MNRELPPGTRLQDRYEIDRVLAHGGTSTIYVGHPLQGAGRVAIKQLRASTDPAEAADDLRHFQREFELLRAVAHDALPRALALFEEDQTWFLVEELVPGRTLRDRVEQEGPIPWREAVDIALRLLDVLGWLHAHGVVYRDLQPANVLVADDGTVRLIDLGAARRWRPDATRDTVPLGTPGFAAPEQYGRAQTDARADLYSLGALLHHMVSGLDPAAQAWHFTPLSTLVGEVPEHVSRTVEQAMALDPSQRPRSADQMAALLRGSAPRRAFTPVGPVRIRLHNPDAWAYFSRSFGAQVVAPSVGVLTVPVALTSAALWPVPLVLGAGAGLITALPAHLAWRRWRNTCAEIYDDGLRIHLMGDWWETAWDDLARLRLTFDARTGRLAHAQISAASLTSAEIDGDWPSLRALVDEVIARAGLTEEPPTAWSQTYVGMEVRTYARP